MEAAFVPTHLLGGAGEGEPREAHTRVSEQGGEFLCFSVWRFPLAGDYLRHLLPA